MKINERDVNGVPYSEITDRLRRVVDLTKKPEPGLQSWRDALEAAVRDLLTMSRRISRVDTEASGIRW